MIHVNEWTLSGVREVNIGGELRRTMGPKQVFGELALIYSQPRTAEVTRAIFVTDGGAGGWYRTFGVGRRELKK